jgi:hypothetical protein
MMPEDRWHSRRIAAFLAIGVVLYLALLAGSEWLARSRGDRNPFYRIWAQDVAAQDWIILGASHAMPLDFADMEGRIEGETGKFILNLAATGAGPFVMRLVAERYFADHTAGGVLIVLDGFGFADRRWNEDRIGESDLLPRVPLDGPTIATFASALPRLPLATLANYLTGFSKINNPDRLSPDVWEAEARFADSRRKPQPTADAERVSYLYPPGAAVQGRYFDDLTALIDLCKAAGARVVIVRPPVPERFSALLPMEPDVAARLAYLARAEGVELFDFTGLVPESRFYFDSDHLNRQGVEAWLQGGLAALLGK